MLAIRLSQPPPLRKPMKTIEVVTDDDDDDDDLGSTARWLFAHKFKDLCQYYANMRTRIPRSSVGGWHTHTPQSTTTNHHCRIRQGLGEDPRYTIEGGAHLTACVHGHRTDDHPTDRPTDQVER